MSALFDLAFVVTEVEVRFKQQHQRTEQVKLPRYVEGTSRPASVIFGRAQPCPLNQAAGQANCKPRLSTLKKKETGDTWAMPDLALLQSDTSDFGKNEYSWHQRGKGKSLAH